MELGKVGFRVCLHLSVIWRTHSLTHTQTNKQVVKTPAGLLTSAFTIFGNQIAGVREQTTIKGLLTLLRLWEICRKCF